MSMQTKNNLKCKVEFHKNLWVKFAPLFLVALLFFAACTDKTKLETKVNTKTEIDGIEIVATLFPQYDFAKKIIGDKGTVKMFIPPGVESHTFEPSLMDINGVNEAELMIYTNDYMEPWIKDFKLNIGKNTLLISASEGIDLFAGEDDDHDNGKPLAEVEATKESEAHDHSIDPHVWTNPVLAIKMAENISNALCEIDPINQDYYKNNLNSLIAELEKLDKSFKEISQNYNGKKIYFAGHSAFGYFEREYNIHIQPIYRGISSEVEPGASDMIEITNEMKNNAVKAIFYPELSNTRIADIIAKEIDGEMLLLHSCHNLSKADFEAGITYVELMTRNAENLRKGLQ